MGSEIETLRLRLRPWVAADREPFALLNADTQVMEHFPARLSRAESDDAADQIEGHIDRHGWGLWAVEVPGVAPFIGFIGLAEATFVAPFTPALEVGWRLARPHCGRGLATESAGAVIDLAFDCDGGLALAELVSFTAARHAS